jgi:hypothetical protein
MAKSRILPPVLSVCESVCELYSKVAQNMGN